MFWSEHNIYHVTFKNYFYFILFLLSCMSTIIIDKMNWQSKISHKKIYELQTFFNWSFCFLDYDGHWAPWGRWGNCSGDSTASNSTWYRVRDCTDPGNSGATIDARLCPGQFMQIEKCKVLGMFLFSSFFSRLLQVKIILIFFYYLTLLFLSHQISLSQYLLLFLW